MSVVNLITSFSIHTTIIGDYFLLIFQFLLSDFFLIDVVRVTVV